MGESFFKRPETAADDAAQWDQLRATINDREHWLVATDCRAAGEMMGRVLQMLWSIQADGGSRVTQVRLLIPGTGDAADLWLLAMPKAVYDRAAFLEVGDVFGDSSSLGDDPERDVMIVSGQPGGAERLEGAVRAIAEGDAAPVRQAAENN